jgi:pseudouridine synthase
MVLHEGRNRQIRRMMEAVGHRVRWLHRERVANVSLRDLPEGNWRHLASSEVGRWRRSA